MKSGLPKVLHPLGGKALYLHALGTAQRLCPARLAVIIGESELAASAVTLKDLRGEGEQQQAPLAEAAAWVAGRLREGGGG